jgi:hypothetical protein
MTGTVTLKRLSVGMGLLPAVALLAMMGCLSRAKYQLTGFKRQADGTILLDLRQGDQRIKASCTATQAECSNLALKSGASVDCYMHASPDEVEQYRAPERNKKIDPYTTSGLVCHAQDGRGKVLVMHPQQCVDMKKIMLGRDEQKFVGRSPEILVQLSPSEFFQASRDQQIEYLGSRDPDFAKATAKDQTAYLAYLRTSNKFPQALRAAPLVWAAFVPAAFDDVQLKGFIQELNDKYAKTGREPIPTIGPWKKYTTNDPSDPAFWKGVPGVDPAAAPANAPPLLPSSYEGYVPSAGNPLRFCKDESDHYFDERGKEVRNDTVLLTVLESSADKR